MKFSVIVITNIIYMLNLVFNLEIFVPEYFIGGAFPVLRGCKGCASFNCIKMVVTMNPCPCGYSSDITNYCICSYIIGEI